MRRLPKTAPGGGEVRRRNGVGSIRNEQRRRVHGNVQVTSSDYIGRRKKLCFVNFLQHPTWKKSANIGGENFTATDSKRKRLCRISDKTVSAGKLLWS